MGVLYAFRLLYTQPYTLLSLICRLIITFHFTRRAHNTNIRFLCLGQKLRLGRWTLLKVDQNLHALMLGRSTECLVRLVHLVEFEA